MVRLPVSCAALDENGRTSLMVVRSVDLSAGGVKVVTEHALVPGNRVRVVFRVDDETTARLDATVLRVEPLEDGLYRYAVEPAQKVPKGAILATAENTYGETLGTVTAPTDGHILWRITHALAPKGGFIVGLGVPSSHV